MALPRPKENGAAEDKGNTVGNSITVKQSNLTVKAKRPKKINLIFAVFDRLYNHFH